MQKGKDLIGKRGVEWKQTREGTNKMEDGEKGERFDWDGEREEENDVRMNEKKG